MISYRHSISVRLLCIPIVIGLLAGGCDALSSGSDDSPEWTGDWFKTGVGLKITEQEFVSVIPKINGGCDINEHVITEVNGNILTVNDGPEDGEDFLSLDGDSKEIKFEISKNSGPYEDRDMLIIRVQYDVLDEQIITFLRSNPDIREEYDCD